MKFFIDTANLEEIKEAQNLGILDGVTTNPTLMAREGITGEEAIMKHYIDICNIVDGDVSAEVLATDLKGMIHEGERLAGLHPQIVVKVPVSRDGLKAIKYLSSKNIRINCTLIFTLGQAVLAAKAGATYVSPFIGRIDDIGSDGLELIGQIVNVFNFYNFKTMVLAASIRHTQHIVRCMEIGADVATCPLKPILGLLHHPLTEAGIKQFMLDAEKMR